MGFDLQRGLMLLPPLLLSLTFHEWAHAWSAWRLGDDTAARAGRFTLNPISHIDPIGTILLPLIGLPFGWAKPVPVDPSRFRPNVRMGTGMALTAAAGPLSNLLLAVACTVIFALLARFSPGTVARGQGVGELLIIMMKLNITLAVFNLLPFPPLDGSRIVGGFMPYRFREIWEGFSRIAPFLLLALIFLPGGFIGRIIGGPSDFVWSILERLFQAIV